MLGIDGHKVIVSGKFAEAVRKAAKESAMTAKQVSTKEISSEKGFKFNWK